MLKRIGSIIHGTIIAIILAVALVLIATTFPIPGNIDAKVVLSGSMEPAIHTGSVIVIKPSEAYQAGDIITFGADTGASIPTTHRVVDIRVESGERIYQTKGDANQEADTREVPEDEIAGKVLFSIPLLGYLVDFAKQPIGFIVLIGVPAAVIAFDELKKIIVEVQHMRRRRKDQD